MISKLLISQYLLLLHSICSRACKICVVSVERKPESHSRKLGKVLSPPHFFSIQLCIFEEFICCSFTSLWHITCDTVILINVLYQKHLVCKERTKHRVANQMTRRRVKKFNNSINKKKETKCSNNCFGKYENVSEIEKENVQ